MRFFNTLVCIVAVVCYLSTGAFAYPTNTEEGTQSIVKGQHPDSEAQSPKEERLDPKDVVKLHEDIVTSYQTIQEKIIAMQNRINNVLAETRDIWTVKAGDTESVEQDITTLPTPKKYSRSRRNEPSSPVTQTSLMEELASNALTVVAGINDKMQAVFKDHNLPTQNEINKVVSNSSDQLIKSVNKIISTVDEEARKIRKPDMNAFFQVLSVKISEAIERFQSTPPEVAAQAKKMSDNFRITVNDFVGDSKRISDEIKKGTVDITAQVLTMTSQAYKKAGEVGRQVEKDVNEIIENKAT